MFTTMILSYVKFNPSDLVKFILLYDDADIR